MANTADKQAQLSKCIAEATANELAPEFKFLGEKLEECTTSLKNVIARLEVLEAAAPADGAKRAVRTGGAAKKTATKAAASPGSKVSNALLYFRFAMHEDLDGYRELYGTEDNLAGAAQDSTVQKQNREKDEGAYFSAVGLYLWKNGALTDDDKATVRAHFGAWKEQQARGDDDGQLDEDAQ
jgi:hypothetical protein